jgi:hypothetical protein
LATHLTAFCREALDLGSDVSRLVWSQRHGHGNDHNVEWSTVVIVVRVWLKAQRERPMIWQNCGQTLSLCYSMFNNLTSSFASKHLYWNSEIVSQPSVLGCIDSQLSLCNCHRTREPDKLAAHNDASMEKESMVVNQLQSL